MEKKFEDLAGQKLVDDDALHIHITPDSSMMVVEATPRFWLIIIITVLGLFITFFFLSTLDASELPLWITLALFVWGAIFYSFMLIRKTRCLIDKPSGIVKYFRGGMFGTSLDESHTRFEIKDISAIEMKRYVQRYGDSFQVRLLVGVQMNFELTGKDLKFSTCQAYAEIIKDFINPALPITAVD